MRVIVQTYSHQTHNRHTYRTGCCTVTTKMVGRIIGIGSPVITHAGIAAGVDRAFSRVCLFVCLSVCLFVRALTGKPLEPSTTNLVRVHVNAIAVARQAVIQRSKGQRSRSHGYEHRAVTRLLVTIASAVYSCATCGRCRRGSACRYDCLRFLVLHA